jgi:hypothetical protein
MRPARTEGKLATERASGYSITLFDPLKTDPRLLAILHRLGLDR